MESQPDIAAGRLSPEVLAENFADLHPRLSAGKAQVEAARCHFCYDAPCVRACPTGIDIPNFIRKIGTGNLKGAANDILSANIMGGMCARVCPTEDLCEGVCVREAQEQRPVPIGELQRYATDWIFEQQVPMFERKPSTGQRVAVVGGGPAGLSCAHRLAMLGHDVVVFEAKAKLGGLNEYGIAAYKTAENFAQREIEYLLSIGGIEVRCGQRLGEQIQLSQLREEYPAVFLGIGLDAVNALGLDTEEMPGVHSAVDYISDLRQTPDLAGLSVGRRVIVIGGGSTAIDIAVQSKRLGAEEVTMVYRRGIADMGATWKERELAQTNGVKLRDWLKPKNLQSTDGQFSGIELERTRTDVSGKLIGTGETVTLEGDVLFKAVGQKLVVPEADGAGRLELDGGKLAVNEDMGTSTAGVWAGGDCVRPGADLTVWAVQDGKVAAEAIDRHLATNQAN